MRRKLGFGEGENPLVLIEERDGELVLRPASAVTVRNLPQHVIEEWICEDEAGMAQFESLPRPS